MKKHLFFIYIYIFNINFIINIYNLIIINSVYECILKRRFKKNELILVHTEYCCHVLLIIFNLKIQCT